MKKKDRKVYIVGQLPVAMRYQEWFTDVIAQGLDARDIDIAYQPCGCEAVPASSDFFRTVLPRSITWEMEQLHWVLEAVEPDDVILCLDASIAGLTGLVAATSKPCKMVAFVHGSSFNYMDIFPRERQNLEAVTLAAFDKLFVASKYHKNKLTKGLNLISGCDIINFGWLPQNPYLYEYLNMNRQAVLKETGSVCCVARASSQKRSEWLEGKFEQETGKKINFPDSPFTTWPEYFEFLEQHQFMFVSAQEETFGYPIQEAMLLNVVPICPHDLCYPEFVSHLSTYTPSYKKGRFKQILDSFGNPYAPGDPSQAECIEAAKTLDSLFFDKLAKELMKV